MDTMDRNPAPGSPGIVPRWTSSTKSGVGTAASDSSRVWFTISHGILNEIYYPRIDQANTRDCGFMVTDRRGFFSEEKRHTHSVIRPIAQGVPAYHLVNRCIEGRYEIEKTVLTDPARDVLLTRVRFRSMVGRNDDYRLFVLLAPHIGNCGYGNHAWIDASAGAGMLFAERGSTTLALACSTPFAAMSVGYVGTSDGWQLVSKNGRLIGSYTNAPDGNVALTGEINLAASSGEFTFAVGFGRSAAEAAHQARAALSVDFEAVRRAYLDGWLAFQTGCTDLGRIEASGFDLYRVSTAVLKTHEAKDFPGGLIASLSIPWGFEKGDEDLGGYHLVWPRDLVESAGGMLAAGDLAAAQRALVYLMATQLPDGHWPQNMWLDGTPYWNGVQMDETAFPILLADLLRRNNGIEGLDVWPMVRRAVGFILCNGPITQQDRWEEDGGFSPFTLAVEIASLLAAADFADEVNQAPLAGVLRDTADYWNEQIEKWTYVTGTEEAKRVRVDGYYVRIAPVDACDASSPAGGFVAIKNRPPGESTAPFGQIVSPDALALVRFGLRAPDDPRIVHTVKVIDALLRTETASGPVWHRYNEDGYGEHDDGSPFDGTGRGRGWPLLAGERAHYSIALGDRQTARDLLRVMASQASPGGLLPEQIWEAKDIPDRELINGHPSGSAMPLAWAHAEYIKALRSLRDGQVFDMPPQTAERYQKQKTASRLAIWQINMKTRGIAQGRTLRLCLTMPAQVHWSVDDWRTLGDIETTDSGVGLHFADLPTEGCLPGTVVRFTFRWQQTERWEGNDFSVRIEGAR